MPTQKTGLLAEIPTCWIIAGPNGAGKTYLKLVDRLKAAAWRVELIYLALPNTELSRLRVAERVKHGGHNIPEADIARRFPRSLYNLLHLFAPRVDQTRCFMNSDNVPALVFRQNGRKREIQQADIFDLLLKEAQA